MRKKLAHLVRESPCLAWVNLGHAVIQLRVAHDDAEHRALLREAVRRIMRPD